MDNKTLKGAIEAGKAGCISCPVCGGSGIVDPAEEPVLKAAWEAVNEEAIRACFRSLISRMLKPPVALRRRFGLSRDMLALQKRVKDFAEAAAVLRRLSGQPGTGYALLGSTVVGDWLFVDVEFESEAAARNGVALFGKDLKEVKA